MPPPPSAPADVDLPTEPGPGRRAAALPADERRASIVAATLPLLLEGGPVTTRHIAEAAGIAEGTIFRVFPDKEAVLEAAVDLAMDPEPTQAALRAIDRSLPLEAQLAEAVAIVQHRLSVIWRVVAAAGVEIGDRPSGRPDLSALTDLLAAHAPALRTSPEEAGRHLRALTLASSHPALVDEPLRPAEVVSLLLDGIRARGEASC